MANKYPIYIVSKGRADTRLTSKALEKLGAKYRIVIEAQEYKDYAAVIDPKKILILDPQYQLDYEAMDNLGMTKGKGPGPARNFVWDHSIAEGHARHWVMDDNISAFYRFQNNLQIRLTDDEFFLHMENFVDRYTNVAMAGPNYESLVKRKEKNPPLILNTRIYSCNLILNSAPYRWRGRYNEDTDLSLRMLKDGWCTVQFNAFLQKKVATQVLKGGNTAEFYAKEGTLNKSLMQVRLHPDVSKMVYRFNRIHHHVDYRPFKTNRLIKRCEAPT